MPQSRNGARLRRLFLMAAPAVVAVAALSGVAQTITARPPSTATTLPPEAYRPLQLPSEARPSTPRTLTGVGVPDAGIPEPTPAPTAIPTPEATPPAGPEHVVRTGDTLWQIAAWHRADIDLVLRWNPTIDPRGLVAGQRVLVPGGGPMPVPTPTRTPSRTPTRSVAATPVGRTGSHLWPLPVRGTITTRFSTAHPGIDIAARAGTPVRAIAGGTVTWAGWKNNGGGYVVVIRHPDGMLSTYNHNREILVRVGQVVASGQPIAAVGSTGWSTGPHLDLRIEMGRRLIDPLRLGWTR